MEAQDTGVKPAATASANSDQLSRASSLEKQEPKDGGKLEPVETEEVVYPSGAKVAVIMCSLYISMFLVALDRTIIATAIPRITDEFHSIDVGFGDAMGFSRVPSLTVPGHWVVWLCVHVNSMWIHSLLWTHLHLLFHEVDVPFWHLLL